MFGNKPRRPAGSPRPGLARLEDRAGGGDRADPVSRCRFPLKITKRDLFFRTASGWERTSTTQNSFTNGPVLGFSPPRAQTARPELAAYADLAGSGVPRRQVGGCSGAAPAGRAPRPQGRRSRVSEPAEGERRMWPPPPGLDESPPTPRICGRNTPDALPFHKSVVRVGSPLLSMAKEFQESHSLQARRAASGSRAEVSEPRPRVPMARNAAGSKQCLRLGLSLRRRCAPAWPGPAE